MTERIDAAIRRGTDALQTHSESPQLDAELLLANCLQQPRSYLYSWPEQIIDEACWQRYLELLRQRLLPTPIAYLLGSREFYALDFITSPAALVPRQETELLIEQALAQIPVNSARRILDLGTGTGNIAITLKKNRPMARIVATDIDPQCLTLAQENAVRHQVEINFIQSHWFNQLSGQTFDLIVSNPPYIAANHPLIKRGDLPAEPDLALTPGETGLEALEVIIGDAANHLSPAGHVMVEHGYDQEAPVARLFQVHGFKEITCVLDLNNLPRVTQARLG